WNERFVTPFRERISAVLARGIASGRIRRDCDVDLVAELMLALPLHAKMRPHPVDLSDLAERFTNTLFEGLLKKNATK
ncbi:MAG: TetR/AcrR family transcriptional regulator C-terminal ligand-binding domain-containing protein, partial [Acidimicrobiaceae bacterium]|nr:TetR/AcrR family transcriptional regulator C-terminal ligand-binding domain-containing protein [Acidimicrobiaceae bacterium]